MKSPIRIVDAPAFFRRAAAHLEWRHARELLCLTACIALARLYAEGQWRHTWSFVRGVISFWLQ